MPMRVPQTTADPQGLARGSGAAPLIAQTYNQPFPQIRVPVADTVDPNAVAAPSRIWGNVLEQATRAVGHIWEVQSKAQARLEAAAMVNEFTLRSQKIGEEIKTEGVEPQNWNTEYIKRTTKEWNTLSSQGWDSPQFDRDGKPVNGPDGKQTTIKTRATTRDSAALAGLEIQRIIAHNAIQVQNQSVKYQADKFEAELVRNLSDATSRIQNEPIENQKAVYQQERAIIDSFIQSNIRFLDQSRVAEKLAKFDVSIAKGGTEQYIMGAMAAAKSPAEAYAAYAKILSGQVPDEIKSMWERLPQQSRLDLAKEAATFANTQYSIRQHAQSEMDRQDKEAANRAKLAWQFGKDAAEREAGRNEFFRIASRGSVEIGDVPGIVDRVEAQGAGPRNDDPNQVMAWTLDILGNKVRDPNALVFADGLTLATKRNLADTLDRRNNAQFQRGEAVLRGEFQIPSGLVTFDAKNAEHKAYAKAFGEYNERFARDPSLDPVTLAKEVAKNHSEAMKSAKSENVDLLRVSVARVAKADTWEGLQAEYDRIKSGWSGGQKAEEYLVKSWPLMSDLYRQTDRANEIPATMDQIRRGARKP